MKQFVRVTAISLCLTYTLATASFNQEQRHTSTTATQQQSIKKGKLKVITGCMFAGKTEELLRLLRRAEIVGKKVVTIKHKIDNRVALHRINSHNGNTRTALPAYDFATIKAHITPDVNVVAIEEIQFFPLEVIDLVEHLVEQGKLVIVSGLDLDFRGEPFGIMPELMARADKVIKLSAICVKCGKKARKTQRVVNGRPARWDDPLILVGGVDSYEARCRNCFTINRPPSRQL